MNLRWAILILCVAFGLVVAVNAFYVLPRLSEGVAANARAGQALCALRGDLQARVDSTKDYLASHPNGAPGIPAKLIREGLDNQQRTITSLRSLHCPVRTP